MVKNVGLILKYFLVSVVIYLIYYLTKYADKGTIKCLHVLQNYATLLNVIIFLLLGLEQYHTDNK